MEISRLRISVVIPCFNEEGVVETAYQRLSGVVRELGCQYELIFINDGSSDRTLEILENISAKDDRVVIINFSRNFGHQAAVTSGIHHCTGEYAVIIDADLQDPPEVIPQMLETMTRKKCNVVYGVRRTRKGETFFKNISAKLFYRILNFMSEVKMPVDTGDFRMIDKKVIEAFKSLRERHKYIRGLITWVGFKQEPLYYDREPRFAGETKYPFFKMLRFATFGLLYFTKKPLKMATGLGFFSIGIGIMLIIYIFMSKLFYPEKIVTGWASVLTAVTFFGGVQLVTVGVLGEYIGNIFDEVKNRPEYIVDKVVRKPE